MPDELDEVLLAFTDFLNHLDQGVEVARGRIRALKVDWNPEEIRWTETEGPKGFYERSGDRDNPQFQALLRDLQQHDGTLSREGYFYWLFRNGRVVGRKKQGVQKERTSTPEKEEKRCQEVEGLFPEDLRNLFSFEEQAEVVRVVPRQFLGTEVFAEVLDVVRKQGGKWVSAGKQSHFQIPK